MSDSQLDGDSAENPEDDPEISALLDFEAVPRKRDVEGGWTPELQREFITRLAAHGSATKACDEMGKNQTGIMKLYRSPLAASFRTAWDGAVALAKQRRALLASPALSPGTMPPTLDHRRKYPAAPAGPLPGQVRNEFGQWEDEAALQRRAEKARDSISTKLLNARRLYLHEIAKSPGKRAAFEILTELPIDWEKADRLEPQLDEPWRKPNMRNPDMLLTAENGWMGDMAHGPDKKAELRKAMNDYLIELGQPPVDWAKEEG